jgi:hypothetical protein
MCFLLDSKFKIIIFRCKADYSYHYLLLSIFLRVEFELFSQPSCEIFSNITETDTVDFGKCLVGDSLISTFTIKNTGTTPLRIIDYDPSFVIGLYKDYLKNLKNLKLKNLSR